MAVMTISFHDDTHEEIEFTDQNGLYWKPTMQGLVIKTNGVRGSRTVYPWTSIRKYHIETEVGLRDRERIAKERTAERLTKSIRDKAAVIRGGAMGGRGDVPEPADQGGGGA